MNIFHAEVGPKLRGEGIGQDLVAAAVNFARKNGLKIIANMPLRKKGDLQNAGVPDFLV